MKQNDPKALSSNAWEADPWDASEEIASAQSTGFRERAAKAIAWTSIHDAGTSVLRIEVERLRGADIAFYATLDGEDMVLQQLIWHGWPDPPEWRLLTRPSNRNRLPWVSWGYFDQIPERWIVPGT